MPHSRHMNDQSFATWRSILIGALLIPLNSYWHIQMTLVWRMNFPAILTLLFNVIFILLLLVAGNRLWAQYSSHTALQQNEHIYHVMHFDCPLRLRHDAVLGQWVAEPSALPTKTNGLLCSVTICQTGWWSKIPAS